MNLELNGRVALVTGGSKGIGLAIAKALIQEGAKVAIAARGTEALQKAVKELPSGSIFAVSADATDQEAVTSAVARVVGNIGGLDILVNNVGGAGQFGGFDDLSDSDWRNAFELNVLSMVHYIRAAEQHLRKSARGRIINISSISGVQPGAFNPHYTVTKAATINLSKYLAGHYSRDGILVNVVCPGPVHSESWNDNVSRLASQRGIPFEEAWQEIEREETSKIPIGRVGEAEDVAGLVAYLASAKADWITGSCFHVNGGKLRSML